MWEREEPKVGRLIDQTDAQWRREHMSSIPSSAQRTGLHDAQAAGMAKPLLQIGTMMLSGTQAILRQEHTEQVLCMKRICLLPSVPGNGNRKQRRSCPFCMSASLILGLSLTCPHCCSISDLTRAFKPSLLMHGQSKPFLLLPLCGYLNLSRPLVQCFSTF